MKQNPELVRRTGSVEMTIVSPEHKQIEELAYQLWVQRGRPIGSPQVDWLQAEEELRGVQTSGARAA